MPVLPSTPSKRRRRSLSVRLPAEVEERLQARLAETGLRQGEAVARLLEFALELEAEVRDLEPELSCYASNRSLPIARALVQLAGRSLGIEPVDIAAPLAAGA